MFADLHIHTTYSTGTDTPKQILELATQYGLSTIAITDLDTVDGVKKARTLLKNYNIKLINGVELSSVFNGNTVHILGYHLDINSSALKNYLDNKPVETTESTRINFENAIKSKIFNFDWERVLELNPGTSEISGINVIYAMNKDNYKAPKYTSNWELYRKHLHIDGKHYIKDDKKTPYDAIYAIKKSGGIPVLAHPYRIKNMRDLAKLISQGILGLEVYHSHHTPEDSEKYLKIAKENNLFVTGGTGWHGQVSDKGVMQFGLCGLDHGDYGILKIKSDEVHSFSPPTFY